jgi:hypothetical protein
MGVVGESVGVVWFGREVLLDSSWWLRARDETSFAGRSSPVAKAEGFRGLYQVTHLFWFRSLFNLISLTSSHTNHISISSLESQRWNATVELKGSVRDTS